MCFVKRRVLKYFAIFTEILTENIQCSQRIFTENARCYIRCVILDVIFDVILNGLVFYYFCVRRKI